MVIFVTSNKHKFEEISLMFNHRGIPITWKRMKYEELQADDTRTVSLDSCMRLREVIREPFFLEDTGLYIESLKGFPGPYSSYVAGTIGNRGILDLLAHGRNRSAAFITVISYFDGREIHQFEGSVKGAISYEPAGSGGFGYDPIFMPEGTSKTLAQMSDEEKNAVSHRGMAVSKLISFILAGNA